MLSSDLEVVERKIQDLLLDGGTVCLSGTSVSETFRFAKAGEPFEDGDFEFEPLETGVFRRLEGSDRPHWVHVGHVDTVSSCIMPFFEKLSEQERESVYVGMVASRALSRIGRSRLPRRRA